MNLYVAYYRFFPDNQREGGVSLETQHQAVASFVTQRPELLAEFTEIESRRKNERPQLAEALTLCRYQKATLLIARLDRLTHDVSFISTLMESQVDFIALDMPEANRLTIHVLAAVAQHEREMISERTKAALQKAKMRGTRLGNPDPLLASQEGLRSIQANRAAYHATVRPLIEELRRQGLSLSSIAEELTQRNVPTARGGLWYAATVKNILK